MKFNVVTSYLPPKARKFKQKKLTVDANTRREAVALARELMEKQLPATEIHVLSAEQA